MTRNKAALKMPEELVKDMNSRLPGNISLNYLQNRFNSVPFKMVAILNSALMDSDISDLELSVRSSNALKRAGFYKVGDLVNGIDGYSDLKKIRNCGDTSAQEIMARLFFYQYSILPEEKRSSYLLKVLKANDITIN